MEVGKSGVKGIGMSYIYNRTFDAKSCLSVSFFALGISTGDHSACKVWYSMHVHLCPFSSVGRASLCNRIVNWR